MPCRSYMLMVAVVIGITAKIAWGQAEEVGAGTDSVDLKRAQIDRVTAAERLTLQDIDNSIELNRPDEVVDRLLELSLRESPRVIETGMYPPGFVSHLPLTSYLQDRLLRMSVSAPEVLKEYRRRIDPIAAKELKSLRLHGDAIKTRQQADRFMASTPGPDFLVLAAEQAMARGWFDEAWVCLARCGPPFQAVAQFGESTIAKNKSVSIGVPWSFVLKLQSQPVKELSEIYLAREPSRILPDLVLPTVGPRPAEIAVRIVMLQRAKGHATDRLEQLFEQLLAASTNTEASGPTSDVKFGDEVLQLADVWKKLPKTAPPQPFDQADQGKTLGGSLQRTHPKVPWRGIDHQVLWSVTIPELSISEPMEDDLTKDLRVPSSHPVLWRDKVLLQTPESLRAFEATNGDSWPIASRSLPVWRSQFSVPQVNVPSQLPVDGQTHLSLSLNADVLTFRDGSPVTGWLPAVRREQASQSRLVAIDLQREGKLLEGFPWQPKREGLLADLPEGLEIEGCPLVVQDRIYVGLMHRDAANLRSYLVCLDFAGEVQWVSPLLAAARVNDAIRRLHVSHSLASYSQGVIYYHASLGTVAAIDAETGRLRWLTQYPRYESNPLGTPFEHRGATRDITTLCVEDDFVYAAPADCDRVFALLRGTGQPVWATAPGEAKDGVHLLGVTDQHLMVSGDRLYWIDRYQGLLQAAFPASTSKQPNGALPEPRGVGRSLLMQDAVCFVTREEIYVFASSLNSEGIPHLLDRVSLGRLGLEGGSLMADHHRFYLSSPGRLTAFAFGREK